MGLREDILALQGQVGSGVPGIGGIPTPSGIIGQQLEADRQKALASDQPLSLREQIQKHALEGAKHTLSDPLSFITAPTRAATAIGKKTGDIEAKGARIVGQKLGFFDKPLEKPGKESNVGKDASGDFAAQGAPQEDGITKAYGGLNLTGGGGVIPAHEGQTTSKRIEGMYEGAMDTEKAAVLDQEAANIKAIRTQQENAERQAAIYNHLVEQQQAQEQKRAAILDADMANRQKMMDDIRSEKIDPNRMFEGPMGGFRKIMGVIGVALGGYAQGLRGGPNTALEIINKSIDDDVAAQRANLETKKGLLREDESRFGQKMQQYGDERAAALSYKQDVLAAAMATAEAAMGDAKTDQEKARAGTVLGALQKQHADLERQLHPWVQAQVTGLDHRKIYADKFAEAMKGGADEKAADQFATAYVSRLQGKPIVTGASGVGKGGSGKSLPSEIQTQMGSIKTSVDLLDRMDQLQKDVESGKISKVAAQQTWDDLATKYSQESVKAIEGGKPGEGAVETARHGIPPAPWEVSGSGLKYGVKSLLGGQSRKQWASNQRSIMQNKFKEVDEISKVTLPGGKGSASD